MAHPAGHCLLLLLLLSAGRSKKIRLQKCSRPRRAEKKKFFSGLACPCRRALTPQKALQKWRRLGPIRIAPSSPRIPRLFYHLVRVNKSPSVPPVLADFQTRLRLDFGTNTGKPSQINPSINQSLRAIQSDSSSQPPRKSRPAAAFWASPFPACSLALPAHLACSLLGLFSASLVLSAHALGTSHSPTSPRQL